MSEGQPKSYSTTKSWETAYNYSHSAQHEETVYLDSGRVAQELGYDCGAAVMVNALQAAGVEANLGLFTQEASDILKEQGFNMEEVGIPPAVLKVLLSRRSVPFEEKPGDESYTNPETLSRAQQWLEEKIKEGFVIITPIQSTPEYWVINRHTGEITRESEARGIVRDIETSELQGNYRIVHTTTDSWTDRNAAPDRVLRNDKRVSGKVPGVIPATTKDEVGYNGHYVLVVGMTSAGGREFFVTVDSMYRWMQDGNEDIDPEYRGIRFVEKETFMKRWHDRSGTDQEDFNQYGIAIPVNQS